MRLHRRIVLGNLRAARREGLSSRVYGRLLAEIFSSLSGYLMMPVAGLIFAVYAIVQHRNAFWCTILLAMLAISFLRIVLFTRYRATKTSRAKPSVTAGFEVAFAALAIAMSALIGAAIFSFAASDRPQDTVCALILAMGIAGGVSGRNGSRPKIAIAQVAVIIAPLIAALAVGSLAFRTVFCSLLSIFMIATYLSIQAFYKSLKTSYQNEQKVVVLAARLKRSADLFGIALDNMTSGLLFFNADRRVLIANEKVKELLGADIVNKMVGRTTVEFHKEVFAEMGMDIDEGLALKEEFGRIMLGKCEGRALMVNRKRGRFFELRMMPIPDHGAVMSIEDITEKREKEQVIHQLAHYDHLTGLANRVTFEEILNKRLAAKSDNLACVCYLDLDGFKSVNDELGHLAGDQLLRTVASRIKSALGEGNFAARLAGDEFALILEEKDGVNGADLTVKAVLEAIAERVEISGRPVKVTASAGIVSARAASFDPETALRSADTALYEAKKIGGGVHLWFDQQMDSKVGRLRTLTAYLEIALEERQLTLNYQPIVDFRAGRMVACEALARWRHPDLGYIPPSEFIPLAEQSGLIHDLGRWALKQACSDIKAWGVHAVPIAVNISPLQFCGEQIYKIVAEALQSSGVDPSMLEIEITESAIAADPEQMRYGLKRLASLGVGIALDDFGTGYSSLALLHNLPITKIKLDRSFVFSIESDPARARLICSIVQMAQTLQKQLVIEGVETQREFLAVMEAQARFVQGYYFAKPLAFEALKSFHVVASSGRHPPIGSSEAEDARVNAALLSGPSLIRLPGP